MKNGNVEAMVRDETVRGERIRESSRTELGKLSISTVWAHLSQKKQLDQIRTYNGDKNQR